MRFAFLIAILIPVCAQAQVRSIDTDGACSAFGEPLASQVFTFGSVNDAIETIQSIVDTTGLAQNFQIEAAGVPNAAAMVQGSQRWILYNPDFMRSMERATGTRWAGISIMAHEIGHHLNGHTLVPGGSRPPTELEADRFSGFVLQKMGASLDEATAAMRTFGSDRGSATHPGKSDRLAAITAGWQQSCDRDPACSGQRPTNPVVVTPTPAPLPPTTPQIVFTDECVIQGEAVAVRSDSAVISRQSGQIVGQKAATLWPGQCVFDLTRTDGGRYCVHSSGNVFFGTPIPVGNCRPL